MHYDLDSNAAHPAISKMPLVCEGQELVLVNVNVRLNET
jgi:hypothetical protein